VEKFPEAQVPPPEPQPSPAVTSVPPAPPVDTTAEKHAATSGHKGKPQPKESYSSEPKKAARTYVVKKGDTLQKISEKFYGTTKHWRRICEANKKVIKDCDKLEPGTKLVIP
jgi:nucleoid-associated protein YgaU